MHAHLRKNRRGVAALLISLFAITYLDRVCISVAGPRMTQDLHIGPVGWGWLTGIFTISYCLFEIPAGALGDRIGPRRVLTRIVLWWSAFTALTGAATNYFFLLVTRFLFGAGEAGAFPNSSVVIARWFSSARRATMSGVTLMASQLGGALAPLLVLPIQSRYGWRVAFFAFGALGVAWAAIWHAWFRDSPSEKHFDAASQELSQTSFETHHDDFPWRSALQSPSVLALLFTAFCYVYVYNFFQTWFHTFLVRGRGFDERGLWLSALPYAVAACANLAGGAASDALVRKIGLKKGRRALGSIALFLAGLLTIATMITKQRALSAILLSFVYGAITFQQSAVFGVCIDIGKKHAGAMVGLMNTCAQVGGFIGSIGYGYIVEHFRSYDAPFVPMAAMLIAGSATWLKIDASTPLIAEASVAPVPLAV